MAQESCNLDKEEAELLKPSSSPPPSTPSQPPSATSINNQSSSSAAATLCLNPPHEFSAQTPERTEASSSELSCTEKAAEKEDQPPVQFGNRCSSCRKKVGLTGFRCRCGDLFCPRHRYSETHDCSFDYKALGREEISKANPVIKAAKIIKI